MRSQAQTMRSLAQTMRSQAQTMRLLAHAMRALAQAMRSLAHAMRALARDKSTRSNDAVTRACDEVTRSSDEVTRSNDEVARLRRNDGALLWPLAFIANSTVLQESQSTQSTQSTHRAPTERAPLRICFARKSRRKNFTMQATTKHETQKSKGQIARKVSQTPTMFDGRQRLLWVAEVGQRV
jgi:hypothetical protein